MIGGRGEGCVAGVQYYTEFGNGLTQVRQCVAELEKKTEKPHHVESGCTKVNGQMRDIPEPVCYQKIVADGDCQKNALYDDYVGSNEPDAKKCARELERITGKKHEAKQVAQRRVFSDVYKVVLASR